MTKLVVTGTLAVAVVFAAWWAVADRGTPGEHHPRMRWVPGGEFTIGTADAFDKVSELPARRVRVDGFWMDEHLVTNADFRAFVEATGYVTTAERAPDWEELRTQLAPGTPRPDPSLLVPGSLVFVRPTHAVPLHDLSGWWRWTPGASWRHPDGPGDGIENKDDHPVVHVSWQDAVAFAKWAGKTLPTEAQWERAARGGLERKRFVWGDELHPAGRHMANIFQGEFPHHDRAEDGFAGTSPVGSFPANGYGLFDMAGNVWQWTKDAYLDGPSSTRRVIKGGSFLCHASYCESYRPSARQPLAPDTGASHVGFRLVRKG